MCALVVTDERCTADPYPRWQGRHGGRWNDTPHGNLKYSYLWKDRHPKDGVQGVERYAAVIRIYTNLYVPDPYAHDGGTPLLNVVPCALRCDMCFPFVCTRVRGMLCKARFSICYASRVLNISTSPDIGAVCAT